MKYTREQIEDCAHDLKEESANAENALFGSNDKAALMLRQLLAENDALREDKTRMDWLDSSKESHGFCHVGYGEYRHYAHQLSGYKTVREVIDAARKGQP